MRSVMHRIASLMTSPGSSGVMPTDQPALWHHTSCLLHKHSRAVNPFTVSHLDLSCGHVVRGGVVPANGVDQARVVYIAVKLDL